MFKNTKKLSSIIVLILVFCLAFVAGCSNKQTENTKDEKNIEELVMGSASLGSYGYTSLEAISCVLNDNIDSFKTSAISTSGGTENVVLMFNDKIDLGHVNNPDYVKAWNAQKPYKQKYEPVQLLTYGLASGIVAVRADSGINSMEDLEGKKVAIGPKGSTLESIMSNYFKFANINVEPVYLSFSEQKDAFVGGLCDAAVLLFKQNSPYPITMQAEAAVALKYLDYDKDVLEELKKGGCIIYNLPKGATEKVDREVITWATCSVLGARADLSEELVYEIVKTLVENVDELVKISPDLAIVGPETVTSGFLKDIPVHAGAAKYYKEKGIWNDNLTVAK